jgi:hypothetical protein
LQSEKGIETEKVNLKLECNSQGISPDRMGLRKGNMTKEFKAEPPTGGWRERLRVKAVQCFHLKWKGEQGRSSASNGELLHLNQKVS